MSAHHKFLPTVKTDPTDDAYFAELGGRETIERVHNIFYDMLLAHPWLKGFFEGKEKSHLIAQQTDFMTALLGGPKRYFGSALGSAHCHMFIPEEVFDLRHKILGDAMERAKLAPNLRDPWLKRDYAMRRALIKTSPDECYGRYKLEPIIVIPKP